MSTNGLDEHWGPEHVKDYLRKLGFVLPPDDMEPWIGKGGGKRGPYSASSSILSPSLTSST